MRYGKPAWLVPHEIRPAVDLLGRMVWKVPVKKFVAHDEASRPTGTSRKKVLKKTSRRHTRPSME